jgi:hypothetical protein
MPEDQIVTDNTKRDFVLSHVSASMALQDSLIDIWQKVLMNYLQYDEELQLPIKSAQYPTYDRSNHGLTRKRRPRFGETRKVIDTFQSKLLISLFADDYIAAKKVGREDAHSALTVTRLLKYAPRQAGQYRVLSGSILDSLLFGSGHVQEEWNSLVRPGVEVFIDVDANGFEVPITQFRDQPLVNDAQLRGVDIMHFFPQPGVDNIQEMDGAAKYLRMRADNMMKLAERGVYRREAVRKAIAAGMRSKHTQQLRDQYDRMFRPERPTADFTGEDIGGGMHDGFTMVDGYEYYGQVPWQVSDAPHRWRIITVLGNQVVRDIPWPFKQSSFRLPFHQMKVGHINGRYHGISPGEGVRYNQEYIDFLGLMIADATIRAVHPPMLFDIRDTELRLSQAKRWQPDAWIASRHPDRIGTMPYGANFGAAMAEFANIKRSIEDDSGAPGSIQGHGFGINRASATEISQTAQFALDRPEMYARYLENESLPPVGKGLLQLYRQGFMEMFTGDPSAELQKRVGEKPEPVFIKDIMPDFDIQFVGTRNYQSLQKRMAGMNNVIAAAMSIPQFGTRLNWTELGLQFLEGSGFDTLAQDLEDPQVIFENTLMQLAQTQTAQQGNGNGEIPNTPEAGLPPAQTAGGEVV